MKDVTRDLATVRARGAEVRDEDLTGTSPLLRKHINAFGRYHFNLERMWRLCCSNVSISRNC